MLKNSFRHAIRQSMLLHRGYSLDSLGRGLLDRLCDLNEGLLAVIVAPIAQQREQSVIVLVPPTVVFANC